MPWDKIVAGRKLAINSLSKMSHEPRTVGHGGESVQVSADSLELLAINRLDRSPVMCLNSDCSVRGL